MKTQKKISGDTQKQQRLIALLSSIVLLAVTMAGFAADDLLLEWRHPGPPKLPAYISDWTIVEPQLGNSYLVRPPAELSVETWQNLLQRLQQDAAIRQAAPNSKLRLYDHDIQPPRSWYVDNIELDRALVSRAPFTPADKPPIIAVIDSGLPPSALRDKAFRSDLLLPGYSFIDRNEDITDRHLTSCSDGTPKNWHGTAVTSIISSLAHGKYLGGITGHSETDPYTPIQIMPLRVLSACGGETTHVADAIDWAVQKKNRGPADIINMSLGSKEFCPHFIQKSINKAIHKNSLVVVAAGNDFIPTTLNSPSNCVGVLSVTGHNYKNESFDSQTAFSYGRSNDLSAPGFFINTLYVVEKVEDSLQEKVEDSFQFAYDLGGQGTSFAAPIVSAMAGLLQNRFPLISLPQLSAVLSFRQPEQASPAQANLRKSIEKRLSDETTADPVLTFIQQYYSEEKSNMLQVMPFLGRRAAPLFKTATKLPADTLYDSRNDNSKTLTAHAAAAFEISDMAADSITVQIKSQNNRPLLACLYHANGAQLRCCSNKAGSEKLSSDEDRAYTNGFNCSVQEWIQFKRTTAPDRRQWNLDRQEIMQWSDELSENFSYYLILETIRTKVGEQTRPIDYTLQYLLPGGSPETPASPSEPPAEETPDAPPTEETPDAPPTEETPDAPPTEETPDAPPTEETPDAPPTEETPDAPPTEETPDAPPTEETPDAPPTEETPDAPPTKETPDAPPTKETPDAPPTEETPDAPPTEETPDAPPTEETPDAPPTEMFPIKDASRGGIGGAAWFLACICGPLLRIRRVHNVQ